MAKIAGLDHVISAERSGAGVAAVLDMKDADNRVAFFSDLAAAGIGACGLTEEDSLEAAYLNLIKESR